jgi:hypothetical protein
LNNSNSRKPNQPENQVRRITALNPPPPIFSKYNSWQLLFRCKGKKTVGKDAAAKQQQC